MSKVSNWWYVLPLLFSLIGGVIAYFAIRKRDNDKAWSMIIVGAVVTFVNLFLGLGVTLILSWMIPGGL